MLISVILVYNISHSIEKIFPNDKITAKEVESRRKGEMYESKADFIDDSKYSFMPDWKPFGDGI